MAPTCPIGNCHSKCYISIRLNSGNTKNIHDNDDQTYGKGTYKSTIPSVPLYILVDNDCGVDELI